MKNTFDLICYKGTDSETTLHIVISECDCKCQKDMKTGKVIDKHYRYDITSDNGRGQSGDCYSNFFETEARAMLRAVAYGNGGFPIDDFINKAVFCKC